MDSTRSHITVYNISVEDTEDFEFDYDVETSDMFTELVPDLDDWDNIGWMELEEYDYDEKTERMHFIVETKWAPPTSWLCRASAATHYFQNKLITMATIQKDETCATGIAVMDGEILQNKPIFEMTSAEVGKYYNDDEINYDLDNLDNQIWESIGKFVKVCEQFYLEREEKND
jgi:hypothetical protein